MAFALSLRQTIPVWSYGLASVQTFVVQTSLASFRAVSQKKPSVVSLRSSMSPADVIWNRAAMDDGGPSPSVGDTALASLLYAHGLAMNGGVLHAIECCTDAELDAALAGYRFFGFDSVTSIFSDARSAIDSESDLKAAEPMFDARYTEMIPSDLPLRDAFEHNFAKNSANFSPLL